MKIYLAHPISGLSYEEVVKYYQDTTAELKALGYDVLCPMTGKGYLRTEIKFKAEGYGNPVSTNHAIFERDHWMVTQSDVVFVNLSGTQIVSIGSVMELAWAAEQGKQTIVVMEPGNIHRHAFVLEAADIVFDTYEEAMNYLAVLISGRIE